MGTLDYTVLIAYLIGISLLGVWKGRQVKSGDDYIVAGRQMGLFTLIGTLVMTEYNTSTIVGWSRFGYTAGLYALLLQASAFTSYGVYTLVFAKRWKRINATSITDLFLMRYGPRFRSLTSIFFIFVLLIASATYLKSCVKIFKAVIPISDFWMGVLLYGVVFFSSFSGGLVSVAFTNTISFWITIICIPLLTVFAFI